jgi:type II secretory ATPase GspE/PulE/Tfp pilus assembly ATPase PilB-like protein
VGRVRPGIPALTDILIEAGVVDAAQVEAALEHQRATGVRVGEALVDLGCASENDIGWALARQLGLTFLDLTPEALDRHLVHSFPEGMLRRLLAVPLVRSENVLTVAFGDPTDHGAISELEQFGSLKVEPSVAAPSMILRALEQLAETDPGRTKGPARSLPHAHHAHLASALREGSGAQLLAGQVRRALIAHATEIHYLPEGEEVRIFHRIAGRLVSAGSGPSSISYLLLARLETLGGPAYEGDQVHVRGRAICPLGDQDVALDVSLLGAETGLAITLGMREGREAVPALEQLGLDQVDQACVRGVLDQPAGLILLCGPPRAGCSTTLASLLAAAPLEGRRTLAFERPGGLPLPAPTRLALPADVARRSWSEIAVAQDADVVALDDVLVGEHAAGALVCDAMGRLVLATSDWCDSFALIGFLASRPGGAEHLASRLRLVVQQRMARFEPASGGDEPDAKAMRPVHEVLVVSDAFREALREGASLPRLRSLAALDGHRDLAQQLHALVTAGRLSSSEATRILS